MANWIKSSDRLPTETGVYFIKSAALGKIIAIVSDLSHVHLYIKNCEWLDESESPTLPSVSDTKLNQMIDKEQKVVDGLKHKGLISENDERGWEWACIFHGALSTLVDLKDIKDTQGKTEQYEENQPKAWYAAKQAIELFKQSDYQGKPPAPSVGIGLVEQLSGANPYDYELGKEERFKAWERCCAKLRELIETQSVSDSDGEKEVMIQAFDKVRKMFESRSWIMDGRGSYPYNDDRYKEEVRYLYDEFDALQENTWENIKSKTFEYRNKIIAEYVASQSAPLSGSIEEQAKAWAKWYANEGSYQDWLKLPSSPFGIEGDFAKTLRVAEAAFIAGHNYQPSVRILIDALNKIIEMNKQQAEDQYGDAKKAETWSCVEVARQALQQFNTGEEKQEQDDQNDLWNKIVAIVAAADICKTDPVDGKEITSWKNDVIERIKTDYNITKNK